MKAGIIDPTKVVRTALQNAASVAGLLLTTEAMVSREARGEEARRVGSRSRVLSDGFPRATNAASESIGRGVRAPRRGCKGASPGILSAHASAMSKVVGTETSPEKRRPSTESLRRLRRESEAAKRPSEPTRADWSLRFAPEWLRDLDAELASRYARLSKRLNEYGYDPFGFDESVARYPALLTAAAYRYWFRVESRGLEHVPPEARCSWSPTTPGTPSPGMRR